MDFIDKMAISHREEITETGKDIQEWLEVRAKQAVWIPVKLSSWFIFFELDVDMDDALAVPS